MHEVDFIPYLQLLFLCTTMHEVGKLSVPHLLFMQIFFFFFCVLIVIVLPGPDRPWRCHLFNRPRHVLSHVRLFLQNQVTSALKLFATISRKAVKFDAFFVYGPKLCFAIIFVK